MGKTDPIDLLITFRVLHVRDWLPLACRVREAPPPYPDGELLAQYAEVGMLLI